jgi:hypothetical protein
MSPIGPEPTSCDIRFLLAIRGESGRNTDIEFRQAVDQNSQINRTSNESNCAIGIVREPFSRLAFLRAVTEKLIVLHISDARIGRDRQGRRSLSFCSTGSGFSCSARSLLGTCQPT